MNRRTFAPVYTHSKEVETRGFREFCQMDGDNLYAWGLVPTTVTPRDLGPWYVFGSCFTRDPLVASAEHLNDERRADIRGHAGYVSARGVKRLLYVSQWPDEGRLFDSDALLVSYQRQRAGSDGGRRFDCAMAGWCIPAFLEAVRRYSPECETECIAEEVALKADAYAANLRVRSPFEEDGVVVRSRAFPRWS